MRERNIKNIANHIFWLVIYLLPIITMLFYAIANAGNTTGTDIDQNWIYTTTRIIGIGGSHENIIEYNIIYKTIYEIFGSTTFGLKIFSNATQITSQATYCFICTYITYIVELSLIRVLIQIITLIPKLTTKMFKSFIGGSEDEIC